MKQLDLLPGCEPTIPPPSREDLLASLPKARRVAATYRYCGETIRRQYYAIDGTYGCFSIAPRKGDDEPIQAVLDGCIRKMWLNQTLTVRLERVANEVKEQP